MGKGERPGQWGCLLGMRLASIQVDDHNGKHTYHDTWQWRKVFLTVCYFVR
jgi:hypothetical protein